MEYQGVKLDVEQIVCENESLRGKLYESAMKENNLRRVIISLKEENGVLRCAVNEKFSEVMKGELADVKKELMKVKEDLAYLLDELVNLSDFDGFKLLRDIERNTLLAAKNVLTFDDVALLTGLSKSQLYKLTSTRQIPHYKPSGKNVYFERKEVEDWLRQNPVHTDK